MNAEQQPNQQRSSLAQPEIVWVSVGGGRLALRGRPGRKLIAHLKALGCDRVVTLLGPREGAEELGKQIQAAGIAWTWLPLDNAQTPTGDVDRMLRAALPVLAAHLAAGESIILHCSAGIHRTGMIAYGLLRWLGNSPEQARDALHQLRAHTAEGMQAQHFAWGDAVAGEKV